MKRNCFIYTVIIGTILIASAIYLIENNFSEMFLDEGKKIIISEIEADWNEDLAFVANSEQKDSLKSIIKEFIFQVKGFGDLTESSQAKDDFTESIVKSFKDSLITKEEIADITELLLKVKNEKHEGN